MKTRTVQLGEVASVFNGKTPSKAEQRSFGHPVIKIKDVDEVGSFVGHFDSFVDREIAAALPDKLVKEGDTLILNAAHNAEYVGSKSFFVRGSAVGALATGEWLLVRPTLGEVDPAFVHFWSQHTTTRKRISGLVKGIHLYPNDVADIPIDLPPLAEQQRIAGVLEQAGRILRTRRYTLELSNTLLPAAFLELFGDPVYMPKSGSRPCKLGELCETIVDCPHSTPEYVNRRTLFPCIRSSDLQNGYLDMSTTKYIESGDYQRRTVRTKPVEGDIIYCREGERFGNAARIPSNLSVCLGQRVMLFRADPEKATSEFLWGFLLSETCQRQARQMVIGTTSPHVNVADIVEFRCARPPISVQQKFTSLVERHGSLRAVQLEASRQAEHLFQSLLHRAFTG